MAIGVIASSNARFERWSHSTHQCNHSWINNIRGRTKILLPTVFSRVSTQRGTNSLVTTRENWVWSIGVGRNIRVSFAEYKMTSVTMTTITANDTHVEL